MHAVQGHQLTERPHTIQCGNNDQTEKQIQNIKFLFVAITTPVVRLAINNIINDYALTLDVSSTFPYVLQNPIHHKTSQHFLIISLILRQTTKS
jgi:hypothetical protein